MDKWNEIQPNLLKWLDNEEPALKELAGLRKDTALEIIKSKDWHGVEDLILKPEPLGDLDHEWIRRAIYEMRCRIDYEHLIDDPNAEQHKSVLSSLIDKYLALNYNYCNVFYEGKTPFITELLSERLKSKQASAGMSDRE